MRQFFISIVFLISVLFSSCTVVSHKEFAELDYRNEPVPVVVYGIPFSGEITINMKKTDNYNFSKADMSRCYLQAAYILKDKQYKKVYLANKGDKVFFMTGEYFKELGYLYSIGEVPNLEMPSHLYNMDGTQAYASWSGGWLGVMNKQLEDHSDMMDKLCP